LALGIKKKVDVNVCSFNHTDLRLLLRYLVKCRSRSLTNNNEFILVVHASAQKITETTKSLKICCFIFTLKF